MITIKNCQFTKNSRFKKAADYKNLFNTGKKCTNRHFAFFVKPNQLQYARLGLVVAKKAVSTAVRRNLYKRMIRESFRLNQRLLVGLDIVVVVYHHISQLNRAQIRETLDKEWIRLNSFCKKS